MPITEEKAVAILEELIKKPESKAEDIPRIWQEIINVYNTTFAPAEEPKKKRRRRTAAGVALGWPAGVGRSEFKAWKEAQQAKGVAEGLNPHEYKRQKDAGMIESPASYGPEFFKEQKPQAQTKPKAAPKKAKK